MLAGLVMAAGLAAQLMRIAGTSRRPPRWDEAHHGFDGLSLADAVSRLDAIDLIRNLHRMAYWPPGFPLLEMPAFWIAGSDFGTPRAAMGIVFGTCVIAILGCALRLGGGAGALAGILAAALLCTSPMFHLYGTIVMLELPGAMLLLLSFWTYAGYLRSGSRRDLIRACIAALALFFCKYNFGIMWFAAVTVHEAVWVLPARVWQSALSTLRSAPRVTQALAGFLGLFTCSMAALVLTRRSPANPISFLIALLVILFLTRPRRNARALRRWVGGLRERYRIPLMAVVVPIIVWLAIPPHMKAFFYAVMNRGTHYSLAQHATWYPKDWMHAYSISPAIGAVTLVIGLLPISLLRLARATPAERLLTVALWIGCASVTLHPLKEARFLLVVAPLLWLSFAMNAVRMLSWVASSAIRRKGIAEAWRGVDAGVAVLAIAAAFPLAASALRAHDPARASAAFEGFTLPEDTLPVLDAVIDCAERADATTIAGTWDGFSPKLLAWRWYQRHGGREESRIPTGPKRRDVVPEPSRFLTQCASNDRRDGLVVLERLEGSSLLPGIFDQETGWLQGLRDAVAREASFTLAGERAFPDAGYRMRWFIEGAEP